MYVRWNRHKRATGKENYIYAVLVESHRVAGKPRQRTIKYLGGIRENTPYASHRESFWKEAEKKLYEAGLVPEAREKVILKMKTVVPRPSEEDVEKEREEINRRTKELLSM